MGNRTIRTQKPYTLSDIPSVVFSFQCILRVSFHYVGFNRLPCHETIVMGMGWFLDVLRNPHASAGSWPFCATAISHVERYIIPPQDSSLGGFGVCGSRIIALSFFAFYTDDRWQYSFQRTDLARKACRSLGILRICYSNNPCKQSQSYRFLE